MRFFLFPAKTEDFLLYVQWCEDSEAISLLFFSSYLAAYQVHIRTYYFTYISIDPVESIYPVFLNTFLSKYLSLQAAVSQYLSIHSI
jgi:hypothetical protein